jgi:hypothetical protein
MGRRIPTIPFSGGKPVPGHELETRTIEERVRRAAREIEHAALRVDDEVRHRPHVNEAVAIVGAGCALLGVFLKQPLARVLLVALGGYAVYRYAPRPQSVKGMLP